MKKFYTSIIAILVAAFVLSGCGYNKYLASVENANVARVSIVKEEQKAKVAASAADESGFKALETGAKSDNPIVAAVSASQLGTILAVRAVTKSFESGKSAASAVQNAEKPTDPVDSLTRLASIAVGGYSVVRQSDNAARVQIAQINGETERSVSRDSSTVQIAGNAVGVATALVPALSVPSTVVNASGGSAVNTGGTQTITRTVNDTQTVNCATGSAGSSGAAGNGTPGSSTGTGASTSTTPAQPGGSSGPAGAGGSNGCNASK
ncbi:MAG: hypothetical protein ACXWG8_10320 [Usitatibacter sp.]